MKEVIAHDKWVILKLVKQASVRGVAMPDKAQEGNRLYLQSAGQGCPDHIRSLPVGTEVSISAFAKLSSVPGFDSFFGALYGDIMGFVMDKVEL